MKYMPMIPSKMSTDVAPAQMDKKVAHSSDSKMCGVKDDWAFELESNHMSIEFWYRTEALGDIVRKCEALINP